MRYLLIVFLLFIFPLNVNAGNFLEEIIGGAVKFGQKDRDFRKNGKFCLESANHQAAIQACNRALKYKISNNDNANLFSARGSHFLELGKQGQALHDFNEALKYNPKHSFALNNRGVIKQRNADYQGALADYKQATRYNTQFEANVKQVQEIINSLAEAEKVHIVKDQGWCEIWKSGELVEQAECKKVSECNSYEICNDIHTWPSGSRTRLYFADTFLETINDIIAKEVFILGTPCALNSKTKNTFCFSKQKRNIKIATAEDQLSDRNSSSQHVAQDYEPGENEQEPEPEEFLSSPDNCFDILKSKSYDYAMENGCYPIYVSCFSGSSLNSDVRKSEDRAQCIKFLAAFATSTGDDLMIERHQTALDLMQNPALDQTITVTQKDEISKISNEISEPCLRDVAINGYDSVYNNNKACRWQFNVALSEDENQFVGWCSNWDGDSYILEERCLVKRECDPDGGEICEFSYQWISGAKTKVVWMDGTPEKINDKQGNLASIRGNNCIINPNDEKTFCYHRGRIATAADGAFPSLWVEEQMKDEQKRKREVLETHETSTEVDVKLNNQCLKPAGFKSVEDATQHFFRLYPNETQQREFSCSFGGGLFHDGRNCMQFMTRMRLESILRKHDCKVPGLHD